jgi:hypothetical protein
MRVLAAVLLFFALSALLVPIAGYTFFKADLIKYIESKAGQALAGKLQIDDFKVQSLSPFVLIATGVTLEVPAKGFYTKLNKAQIGLFGVSGFIFKQNKLSLSVALEEGDIKYKSIATGQVNSTQAQSGNANEGAFALPVGAIRFAATKFNVEVFGDKNPEPIFTISELETNLSSNEILNNEQPLSIGISGNIKLSGFPAALPLLLEVKDSRFDGQKLKVNLASIELLGLGGAFEGHYFLDSSDYGVKGKIDVPDLSSANQFSKFLLNGKFTGSIGSTFSVQGNKAESVKANFAVKATDVVGEFNYNQNGIMANGKVIANADVSGNYKQKLLLEKFYGLVDLSHLAIVHKHLKKPDGVLLKASVNGKQVEESFVLDKADLEFSQIKINSKGIIQLTQGALSKVNVTLENSLLNGLEKYLPALSDVPLRGMANAEIDIAGDFNDIKSASINIKSFNAKNVEGAIKIVNEKYNISGPFKVSGQVSGEVKNLTPGRMYAALDADLSKMQVEVKDVFKKAVGQRLSISTVAAGSLTGLTVSKLIIELPFVRAMITGQLSDLKAPFKTLQVNIKSQIQGLNTDGLRKMVVATPELPMSAVVDANLLTTGKINLDNLTENSAIKVTGLLSAKVPQYKYISEKTSAVLPGKTTPAEQSVAKPLLPNWPVLKNSNVKISALIDTVHFNDLIMKNVKVDGDYQSGKISGNGSIGKVFDGTLNVSKAIFDGFAATQKIPFSVAGSNLGIKEFLLWLLPEYKESAGGRLSFQSEGLVNFPLGEDKIASVNAKGQLQTRDAVFSTVDVNKMIREKIQQMPALQKMLSLKDGDAKLSIASQYGLKDSEFSFANLIVKSSDGNELSGSGRFKTTKNNSFKMSAKIANPKVQTDCKTILDSQGRLPLTGIEVNAFEWTNSTEILTKIAGELAGCEIKKEVQKAGNNLKKDLQKKLDEGLKKFLGK